MTVRTTPEFARGARVIFQYARGAPLHGTIEGWSEKYASYLLRCHSGRKLLAAPAYVRPEPAEDPVVQAAREQHWPSYTVYMTTHAGTQQVWSGKARTPRLAFERAAQTIPALGSIVGDTTRKRIDAGRTYRLGTNGERVYCEKIDPEL